MDAFGESTLSMAYLPKRDQEVTVGGAGRACLRDEYLYNKWYRNDKQWVVGCRQVMVHP